MKRFFTAAAEDGQATLSLDVMAVFFATAFVLVLTFFDVNLSLYYEKVMKALHAVL